MRGCFFIILSLFIPLLPAQPFQPLFQAADDPAVWVKENFGAMRNKNADSARHYVSLAIALAEAQGRTPLAAKLYQLRGIAHYYLGNYPEELASHQQALRLAETTGDKGLQGEILLELGLASNRQQELDQAIAYGRRAMQLCEEAGQLDCLASAQRNLGRSYLKQEELEKAIPLLKASLALRREMNDSVGIPYGLNDMSQLALGAGDYAAAVSYLEESSQIRKATRDTAGLAIDLNNMGEVYHAQGKLGAARQAFERSLVLSRQVNYVNLQKHTLGLLGEVYRRQGDYEAAYGNLQASAALQDSLYGVEKARAISELEVTYETEAKERTIAIQAAELRTQRLIAITVVLSLLLVASLLYYRFFRRRKYEREIARLNLQRQIHEERERISRDLHDSVGANLTRIITDLDLLLMSNNGNNEPVIAQIDDTRDFTQNTIHLLRDTIWALNKDSFNTTEFVTKVKAFLAYYLGKRIAWRVESQVHTERELSPAAVLNLLRILQEATQNMLKHAEASQFVVCIRSEDGHLTLSMTDNGRGMDLTHTRPEDHYGLENMQQRARDIGGTLRFERPATGGLQLRLLL